MKLFKERGHHVDYMNTLSESELVKIIGEYDGKLTELFYEPIASSKIYNFSYFYGCRSCC